MITARVQGGMGNQMFQYAMGWAQANRIGTTFGIDHSIITQYSIAPYKLNQWQISNVVAEKSAATVREQSLPYDQKLVDSIKDGDVLQGYWQTEKYFRNIRESLLRKFVPKLVSRRTLGLYDHIEATNSLAVHVRRGDYLTEPHKSYHGVLPVFYYVEAAEYIYRKVGVERVFMFSDDIEWCRKTFPGNSPVTYVEPGSEAEDIWLMSRCKHAIIANSSFSWWGAWLNQNPEKIVIAPNKWFYQAKEDYKDIVPESWVKV